MKNCPHLLTTLLAIFVLLGCGGDDGGGLVGTWRHAGLASDTDGDGMFESASVDPCEADNTWTFAQDGTWVRDEGATKCDEADPQSEDGTWELSPDGKTLTLTMASDGSTTTSQVIELSDSRLVLGTEVTALGMTIVVRQTLTR